MNAFLKNLIRDEAGATAIEYGLIAALIVLAMMTALQGFANASIDMWSNVSAKVAASNQGAGG